jgi:hypothetical protein
MKRLIASAVSILLSGAFQCFAWSSPGHMIIAAIAYRDLPAKSKLAVNELLTHHPDYAKWAASCPTNFPADLPTFIFMRASTWPDEIRRRGNPHDHTYWHFINLPLIPPHFPDRPSLYATNDIVYGLDQCRKILQDKKADVETRAIYLSWLIHLVGDIHQPLHCVTWLPTRDNHCG